MELEQKLSNNNESEQQKLKSTRDKDIWGDTVKKLANTNILPHTYAENYSISKRA